MAVYTPVSQAEMTDLAAAFRLGNLHHYEGIEDGVENSNYRLHCETGDAVLTLYEVFDSQQSGYFHALLKHYRNARLPVAAPMTNRQGDSLITLRGKPAAVFPLLPGVHIDTPDTRHCHAVGRALADMHLSAIDYPPRFAWDLDTKALHALAGRVMPHMPDNHRQPLRAALDDARQCDYSDLPKGVVHGDLFRDNVLFSGDTVSGILDHYTAHHSYLLYDLAVASTDWCTTPEASFDEARMDALLAGYETLRPLTDAETRQWHNMLRSAVLRFWLSRSRDL